MTPLPVLYSFRRCPYAMRARWALLQAGLLVQWREVSLKSKPNAMLAPSYADTQTTSASGTVMPDVWQRPEPVSTPAHRAAPVQVELGEDSCGTAPSA